MYDDVIAFIRKTYGNRERIFLHDPYFGGNEERYLSECIKTTFVSSVGPFVDRFEEEFAAYAGARKAVVCVNGTNALHMAMMLAGVRSGDEVITQALTFIATCNAVSYIGARPVFVDVDGDTLGLSPAAMRKFLEAHAELRPDGCFNKRTGARIKACVPMHTFGHPVHLDELAALCADYRIELVEDAAEAVGSFYRGKHVGTFGRVGVFSFNGNKTITTGGGGIMLFSDPELAKRAKHLTTQSKIPHRWEFVHDETGYNYRMPNINAALGCAQLEQIDYILSSKRKTAEEYRKFFSGKPGFEFIGEPAECRSNYWLNAVLLPGRKERNEFLAATNDSGVMTRPAWELMNRLDMYRDCEHGDLTVSESIADRLVNLPSGVRQA